jgi:nitronate monooxygenase
MTDARALLDQLRYPIIQAPMAGGPSTAALAIAVSEAGGMGFLASGYGSAAKLREHIKTIRSMTEAAFGINVFVPPTTQTLDSKAVQTYLHGLASEEARYGAKLGAPPNDEESWERILDVVSEQRPPAISFTFGCPSAAEIASLRDRGTSVWVTITDPAEAVVAQERGADAVIAQGVEAGGHRGGFDDSDDREDLSLLPLLRLTHARCELPLIAAGGLSDGAAVAAALCAGASAVQLGSAFMLADEAATHPAHRTRLAAPATTGLTRAFSGRRARGIVNRFQAAHSETAPPAYPEIHYATSPLRAAARELGDADGFNLWAGQAHALARPGPAAEIVRTIAADAYDSIARASQLLRQPDSASPDRELQKKR